MSHPTKFTIMGRKQITINTDPLRRCYDGVNFSETTIWSDWQELGWVETEEDAIASVKSWYEINPRGREYRFVKPAHLDS